MCLKTVTTPKMYTTLDQLENVLSWSMRKISRWTEIRNLIVVLTSAGMISYGVINLDLLKIYAQDILHTGTDQNTVTLVEQRTANIQANTITNTQNIEKILEAYSSQNKNLALNPVPDLQNDLQNKRQNYPFPFNTLIPKNILSINGINVQVPIVADFNKSFDELTKWDFQNELTNWVALFPWTWEPWSKWKHTLIFWHSSSEYRKHNEFGTVFAKLNNVEVWETFTVSWKWTLHTYKIIDKQIISPKDIASIYEKWNNKGQTNYLSLLACYPPWSTNKRVIVSAIEVGV